MSFWSVDEIASVVDELVNVLCVYEDKLQIKIKFKMFSMYYRNSNSMYLPIDYHQAKETTIQSGWNAYFAIFASADVPCVFRSFLDKTIRICCYADDLLVSYLFGENVSNSE